MTSVESLIDQLGELPDPAEQQALLRAALPGLNAAAQDAVAQALKDLADRYLRSDIHRCLATAELLSFLADSSGRPQHRALGLLAAANGYSIGLGEYERAVAHYREATAIYEAMDLPVERATAQIGHVYALMNLSRYDEAIATGRWAADVLAQSQAWLPLARLHNNVAMIHFRKGDDASALSLFEEAQRLYEQFGDKKSAGWLYAEFNRAIVLRNLGRFEAAIAASQTAYELLVAIDEPTEAARAQQNLAITYFLLGRYNEALGLLDQVREVFLADDRARDAILAELFISDCLLQLRRFADVLEKCRRIREQFAERGTRFEMAQAMINEAVAYAGLHDEPAALVSLAEARQLFAEEGSPTWQAAADLETAAILLRQERFAESLDLAERCVAIFARHALPVSGGQALLIAGRSASALGHAEQAGRLAAQALAFADAQQVPALALQAHHLLGRLAEGQQQPEPALAAYERAIERLEQLRGRLMVEFRTDFLEDKQTVYEDAVVLTLDLDRPAEGLEYAERAKSRALLDMLAFRVQLGFEARSAADRPLVESLLHLRAERDRLYRRWESGEGFSQRGRPDQAEQGHAQVDVLRLEKQITDLWHKLLIRNADYAGDASLWQVRAEPIQPYLDPDTLLLEYFAARDQLVAFLVTADEVRARRLPDPAGQIAALLGRLRLNMQTIATLPPESRPALTRNAQGLLHQMYELLLRPLEADIEGYSRLIVVPHGSLHYLPFHAFHDGAGYLLERVEVSYLPAGSFLHYARRRPPAGTGLLAVGYSSEGQLPFAVEEAGDIATLWSGRQLLERDATRGQVEEAARDRAIVHLATHADFRPDNPLFSGLALADGWLTTLDIFDLKLQASLVTLSACQTGRNVIGGGDELLGLMRAFLAAGTSSLVLSQWAVEDRSTAALMGSFYDKLAAGWGKAAALRHAQQQFLADGGGQAYDHPYFWAPFFLVGDPGSLPVS